MSNIRAKTSFSQWFADKSRLIITSVRHLGTRIPSRINTGTSELDWGDGWQTGFSPTETGTPVLVWCELPAPPTGSLTPNIAVLEWDAAWRSSAAQEMANDDEERAWVKEDIWASAVYVLRDSLRERTRSFDWGEKRQACSNSGSFTFRAFLRGLGIGSGDVEANLQG